MAKPFVIRSFTSAANTEPSSVTVAKHDKSPEVAIMTLHRSAFDHNTAKLLIKVKTRRATSPSKDNIRGLFAFQKGELSIYRTVSLLGFINARNGKPWSRTNRSEL